MGKIKVVENTVLRLLEDLPHTRKDDFLLLDAYYDEMCNTRLISFHNLCVNHAGLGLPSFETIRRCRQKIQAQRPDLVDPGTAKQRRKLIEDYKDYAKV
jgi:hypothetical protein